MNKQILVKCVKLPVYNYFRQPSNIIKNTFKLNFESISKIQAFRCVHLSFSNKGQYNFDSDAVESILGTGYSTSIFFELKDFINYKPMDGKVKGLDIHKNNGY